MKNGNSFFLLYKVLICKHNVGDKKVEETKIERDRERKLRKLVKIIFFAE